MKKNIQMYALSTCIYCQNTKRWFAEHRIEYDCIDVDLLEETEKYAILKEMKGKTGMVSFPTVIIDDNIIKGYKPAKFKEVLEL
jgi:glutaredoxin-like protein NrdH